MGMVTYLRLRRIDLRNAWQLSGMSRFVLSVLQYIAVRQPRFRKEIFPYNADSISAAFHRAVVRAGIEDLRWHDLRHEGISRLFERGLSIELVALVSGHQDWAMLRRYTHIKPESLHEEEDLIGG